MIDTEKYAGPVPSARHLAWHALGFYGFIHFTMNTFTNREWGYGDENPAQFNPLELNAEQWAKTAHDAGMKGLILVCKHHDGFCLWPSAYTEHSVKNSPWRDGKGDLVREVSEACRKYQLKFGVYLSPWDRNHSGYGTPSYLGYYRDQLRELLTNYGPVFEVWFDGANGGDGYYGGAREVRNIDPSSYYDWTNTLKIIRELQPEAVAFSDGGFDVRWVGNESGEAAETNWCTFHSAGRYPGYRPANCDVKTELGTGHEDGTDWLPAEVDVSIRPGWFYHAAENGQVRTAVNLLNIYMNSVGRGANLLLNLAPDQRGLIPETDVANLRAFTELRDEMFRHAVCRLTDPAFAEMDGYTIDIPLECATACNLLELREKIERGQRVKRWRLEGNRNGTWQVLTAGTTIGYRRLCIFPKIEISALRLHITEWLAEPVIHEVLLYDTPATAKEPVISRDRNGIVSIDRGNGVNIRYTTDGSKPELDSSLYTAPFAFPETGVIQATVFAADNPGTLLPANCAVRKLFGQKKSSWRIHSFSSEQAMPDGRACNCIDSNDLTIWMTDPTRGGHPHFIAVDMGETQEIGAFGYQPRRDSTWGVVTRCSFAVSDDGENWTIVMENAKFDNIASNPILQIVKIAPQKARYFKFISLDAVDNSPHCSVQELKIFKPGRD